MKRMECDTWLESRQNMAYSDQIVEEMMPNETSVSMVDRPVPGGAHGGPVERPRRPRHHRGGQGHHQPLPAREAQVGRHREGDRRVAQRHEEQGGHEQPAAQRPDPDIDLLSTVLGPVLRRKLGGVAGGGDLLDEPLHADVGRQHGRGALGGVVDTCLDPVERVEPLFDPGRARAAGHAADEERHLRGLRRHRGVDRDGHRTGLSEHAMAHRLAGASGERQAGRLRE